MPLTLRPSGLLRAAALLAAGIALAACSGAVGADTAAVVGDEEIPLSTLTEQYEQVAQSDQLAAQLEGDQSGEAELRVQADVLTELIRTRLLERAVEDLGLDPVTDEDIAQARAELVEQFGGEEALTEQIEAANLTAEDVERTLADRVRQERITEAVAEPVDDAAVRAAYDEQYASEQREVRHVLVETAEQAQQVIDRIEGGEDFAAVAEDVSIDPGSAANGGDLGAVARGTTVEPFEEAVFSADVGELVGPVETEFGYHVIEVTDVVDPPAFADVEADIRADLAAQQGGPAFTEYIAQLLERIDVEVNPRFGVWDDQAIAVVPEADLEAASEGAGAAEPPPAPASPATSEG